MKEIFYTSQYKKDVKRVRFFPEKITKLQEVKEYYIEAS